MKDLSFFDHIVVDHTWWRVCTDGNYLDRKLTEANETQSHGTAFCTEPFLLQKAVTVSLIATGVIYVYLAVFTVSIFLEGYVPAGNLSVVKIEDARISSGDIVDNGSIQLHLWSGCHSTWKGNKTRDRSSIFGYDLLADLKTFCANGSNTLSFIAQSWQDSSGSFQTVASSTIRWTSQGVRFTRQAVGICDGNVSAAYLPPWPWHLGGQSILSNFILGCALLIAGSMLLSNRTRTAAGSLRWAFAILAMTSSASFAGLAAAGPSAEGPPAGAGAGAMGCRGPWSSGPQ